MCCGQQRTDFAVLCTPQIQSVLIGGFNFRLIGEAWALSRMFADLCVMTEFRQTDRTGRVDFDISVCRDDCNENHVLKDLLIFQRTWTSSLFFLKKHYKWKMPGFAILCPK